MDCSPPGSSVHGIFQARIQEGVVISFSTDLPGSGSTSCAFNCCISPGLYLSLKGLGTGFPGGSVVKNPPVMQDTWIQSLDQEDPLEEETANHSSILAWEIP